VTVASIGAGTVRYRSTTFRKEYEVLGTRLHHVYAQSRRTEDPMLIEPGEGSPTREGRKRYPPAPPRIGEPSRGGAQQIGLGD
jgi:hypothetical protein